MQPKLIMIINDTREILELFEEILTVEGYRVSLHSYNTRDLQEVKKLQPDLVISDHLATQEEARWQFIQKIKMDRETANIPIIICTTSRRIVNDAEGHFGVKGISIVFKPFDIDELVETVVKMIGKSTEPGLGKTNLTSQNAESAKEY